MVVALLPLQSDCTHTGALVVQCIVCNAAGAGQFRIGWRVAKAGACTRLRAPTSSKKIEFIYWNVG